MNTLKFKALLIKRGLLVFIRAIGIYLVITLPALGVPLMYMMSAIYAVSFGWMAAAFFLLVLYLLQQVSMSIEIKMLLLYTSVVMAVVVAFQMMELTGVQDHIWQAGGFLMFPAVAIISGWISIAVSRHKLRDLFAPAEKSYYDTIIDDISSPQNTI